MDSSSFYRSPVSKKKSHKKPSNEVQWTNSIDVIKGYHKESHISGILWGGNVWIKDEDAIRVLMNNGCYGNSVVSRHVNSGMAPDGNVSSSSDVLSGCGLMVPSLEQLESPDEATPPSKRPKIDYGSNNAGDIYDTPLYNDIFLNMSLYHVLFLEEAFYLLKRSCIEISTISGNKLSEKEVWLKMAENNSRFGMKYSAYEHFRNNHWVPKCGIKFGVDYVLYEGDGPSNIHSTFSVIVKEDIESTATYRPEESENKAITSCTSPIYTSPSCTSTSCTSTSCTSTSCISASCTSCISTSFTSSICTSTSCTNPSCTSTTSSISTSFTSHTSISDTHKLTWSDILSMGRVNEGVKKDLAICYVGKTPPSDNYDHGYQFRKTVIVKRWLVNKDRLL